MQENNKIGHRANALRMEAVRANGLAIGDIQVRLRTEELCDIAVNENGLALKYVTQTRQRILAAVKSNAAVIQYQYIDPNDMDYELLMAASKSTVSNFEASNYLGALFDGSYNYCGLSIHTILANEVARLKSVVSVNCNEITRDELLSQLYLSFVTTNGVNLELVHEKFQTEEICIAAVYGNHENEPHKEVLSFVEDKFLRAALEEEINEREAQKCSAKESPGM